MKSGLFKVVIGRVTIACFASDPEEAIERACAIISEQYGIDVDTDTIFANVCRISSADVDFNDEVF
ncbi:MAG: hypothetical protein IKL81_05085 [Clostridia bacterium]|nr:hypothetical protein [Clostridia bacterium]